MIRARRLAGVVSILLALAAAVVSESSSAGTSAGPFYLAPSETTECEGIKNCLGSKGPWVEVPATGQATYLFGCPRHIGFIVAGTDARASATTIRVWFEGRLGGRIGPPPKPTGAAVLLFQAASSDGKPGWFQPIVGCVSLTPKNKRSTVSAKAGTPPSAPVDLRAENIVPRQAAQLGVQKRALRCPGNERPASSWSALALYTSNPPNRSFDNAVTIKTAVTGTKVIAVFHLNRLFSILAPRFWIQVGAACEP